jgi:hypothetical protein
MELRSAIQFLETADSANACHTGNTVAAKIGQAGRKGVEHPLPIQRPTGTPTTKQTGTKTGGKK